LNKVFFIKRVLEVALKLFRIYQEIQELTALYIDRGYGSGETAITDQDFQVDVVGVINLTDLNVTKFNEVAGILVQLVTFMEGSGALAATNRKAIINKYRRDV
jgi:hypothetical protein